ncbi:MAG: D-alanine--D-alanine ligase, partial [Deltaproteobacteria bacterium]|nr:D-alanine--D-alanine ligase [Deltaproteobacteria bacterium]
MSVLRGLKKKKIGVLMGGISEEREISLKTGAAVLKALRDKGYRAAGVDVGRDVAAELKSKRIEVAFIALHGRYGEDGCVQGMLEVMGIP